MSFLDDYEPVEDRLRDFWSEHAEGRVITELVHNGSAAGDVLVFKASVYRKLDEDGAPGATGYAHQRILPEPPKGRNGEPNESAPEWTSPYEVAETSAIGRALANLGYAAKGKRPSREEVSKASVGAAAPASSGVNAESEPAAPTSDWAAEIRSLLDELGWTASKGLTFARTKAGLDISTTDWALLSDEQAQTLVTWLRVEVRGDRG